jgi:tetratricopeptide (TPR) repeat protein
MFSTRARLFIAGAFLIMLTVAVNWHEYQIAGAIGMFTALLIWGYFKEGTIILAAKSFHKKNYARTEALLNQVVKAAWLSKKRRGFYEFMMGGVYLQKQDYAGAEKHYELAAQYPLRNANDHVAALGHVVNINIRQGNYEKAKAYLQLADQYADKTNAKMKDVIKRLHEEVNKR